MIQALNASEIRKILPETALLAVEGLPYPKLASGKVRDIFEVNGDLLIVASDRLSAFDVILPTGIPGKGIILTQISLYWFEETRSLIRNHLVPDHDQRLREVLAGHEELIPRSMLVRRMQTLPIEAVVRGYLSGSGWKSYLRTGKLFGQPVAEHLAESDKLAVPYFTPTTKEAVGTHDQPLTVDEGVKLLGEELFEQVRDISLKLYALGSLAARHAGLILADTKFEFGTDPKGQLYLIDEALTPDSSRYWPADEYAPGRPQTAFDKQFVRDYLETLDWDKTAPGPELPESVVLKTRERYLLAVEKLRA